MKRVLQASIFLSLHPAKIIVICILRCGFVPFHLAGRRERAARFPEEIALLLVKCRDPGLDLAPGLLDFRKQVLAVVVGRFLAVVCEAGSLDEFVD